MKTYKPLLQKIAAGLTLAGAAVFGQTPETLPAFEVASIKPSAALNPAQAASGKMRVGMTIDGARVVVGYLSLADLIPIAFAVKPYQISGPGWMSAQRFDIVAKIPEGASKDQVPEMLKALLEERFKLTAHRESKEQAVYALVVGKNGPKLKESTEIETPADAPKEGIAMGSSTGQQVHVTTDSKGAVVRGGPLGTMRMSMGSGGTMHMEAAKTTLSTLADMLSRFVDRPVVDQTGLTGTYQVALDISMGDLASVARRSGGMLPPNAAGMDAGRSPADAASDPSGGSIFAAVQELGLKLEPRKAPLDLVVVDRLEKNPTEN